MGQKITVENFAEIFGTKVAQLHPMVVETILANDFSYQVISPEKKRQIISEIFENLARGSYAVVGSHYKDKWEKGWSENLDEFLKSDFDPNSLVPKFVKKDALIRFCGEYISSPNPNFEISFVNVLRTHLFLKYFQDVPNIYEFGCGTGHNLLHLSKIIPGKKMFGLDWAQAAVDLVALLAKNNGLDLQSYRFDMFHPNDFNGKINKPCGFFTIGALEQIGANNADFLEFIIQAKPSVCINVETIDELYDPSLEFDFVAREYIRKRNYLRGYYTKLKELEVSGKVEILESVRTFGSFYHDGYTFIVWRPENV